MEEKTKQIYQEILEKLLEKHQGKLQRAELEQKLLEELALPNMSAFGDGRFEKAIAALKTQPATQGYAVEFLEILVQHSSASADPENLWAQEFVHAPPLRLEEKTPSSKAPPATYVVMKTVAPSVPVMPGKELRQKQVLWEEWLSRALAGGKQAKEELRQLEKSLSEFFFEIQTGKKILPRNMSAMSVVAPVVKRMLASRFPVTFNKEGQRTSLEGPSVGGQRIYFSLEDEEGFLWDEEAGLYFQKIEVRNDARPMLIRG